MVLYFKTRLFISLTERMGSLVAVNSVKHEVIAFLYVDLMASTVSWKALLSSFVVDELGVVAMPRCFSKSELELLN